MEPTTGRPRAAPVGIHRGGAAWDQPKPKLAEFRN